MFKIVLVRHGESVWNRANKFTGWTDVNLSLQGKKEAQTAGQVLKKKKYQFDIVVMPPMKRTLNTWKEIQKFLRLKKIEIIKDWHLNERHYGDLQGRDKSDILYRFGETKFMQWRRGYAIRPPKITVDNPSYKNILKNPAYKELKIPTHESLKDVVKRVVPYWEKTLVPLVMANKKILIVGCGNSLRALVKHLDKISDKEIPHLNLPTGIPVVYELDKKLKPIKHYFLGDKKKIAQAIAKVVNQGRK